VTTIFKNKQHNQCTKKLKKRPWSFGNAACRQYYNCSIQHKTNNPLQVHIPFKKALKTLKASMELCLQTLLQLIHTAQNKQSIASTHSF